MPKKWKYIVILFVQVVSHSYNYGHLRQVAVTIVNDISVCNRRQALIFRSILQPPLLSIKSNLYTPALLILSGYLSRIFKFNGVNI